MNNIIKIRDIVDGTSINSEGYKLYFSMNNILKNNDFVVLDFKDITVLSTSFLNSSLGELILEFGLDSFRQKVKVKNLTSSQLQYIRKYIERFNTSNAVH